MDQWEQSPVGSTMGTVAGQLSSHPITDDSLFSFGGCAEARDVLDRDFHHAAGIGIYWIPDIDVTTVRHIDN